MTQSSSLCEECPLQGAPPFAGDGSVQLRDRRRPLVVEPQRHGAHGDHSDHPPFTKQKLFTLVQIFARHYYLPTYIFFLINFQNTNSFQISHLLSYPGMDHTDR